MTLEHAFDAFFGPDIVLEAREGGGVVRPGLAERNQRTMLDWVSMPMGDPS
jgi:hypothetical protein